MSFSKKQQLLERAVELVGRQQLAGRMGIPETLLSAWVSGDVTMPDGKLLVLAAILDEAAKIRK